MELIALLLLAPLVFSSGSAEVESPGLVPGPVVVAAVVQQTVGETVVHPPADLRYTMTVLRHTPRRTLSRNPAGFTPESLEVIVSAP